MVRAGRSGKTRFWTTLALSAGLAASLGSAAPALAGCEPAPTARPPVPSRAPTPAEAARFLAQASFGASTASISEVVAKGYAAWIDEQMRLPASSHLAFYNANIQAHDNNDRATRQNGWWTIAVTGKDQLRQRVAFALAEIFVVSESNQLVAASKGGMSGYYDLLVNNAFGNYREVLEKVALSPVMGRYLSMLGNPKAVPADGIRADENFAREILQLMSIGLVRQRSDGSVILADGKPVPTYTQAEVENLARAFTGWSFAGATSFQPRLGNYLDPMVVFRASPGKGIGDYHDAGEKLLPGGVRLPANQTAEQDLKMALDAIAAHANVAPFISRHLIQRLVTSNPTPGYVQRVAAQFRSSQGNLGSTVRTLLLDSEARLGPSYLGTRFGKVREPVLQATHLWRAFEALPSRNNGVAGFDFRNPEASIAQAPYRSPSVFNFFSPGFLPQYAAYSVDEGDCTLAPELQLANESSLPTTDNFFNQTIRRHDGPNGDPTDAEHNLRLRIGRQSKLLEGSVAALVNDLDLLLMSGQMSADFRRTLTDYTVASARSPADTRVQQAIHMIVTSPQYLVQR